MQITCDYQKPLMQRIDAILENLYNTYEIFEEEKLKVYYSFANQFISNLFREKTICRWDIGGYIIESQTGSGKSTLMLNTVIPMAKKRGKRVAIIVPRVALAIQYKKELADKYEPELLNLLTDEGLQQHREYGNVDVYTMQEFINYGTDKEFVEKSSSYEFIIFDEVHAFVGDAAFNPYTYNIFSFLVSAGQFAKRIYITATLDIVIQEIVNMENTISTNGYWNNANQYVSINRQVTLYRFKYDYSFLTLALFAEENSGIELLKKTQDGEKILVFVSSKVKGLKLRDLLGKDKAVFIDAESKMQSEADTFQQIVSRGVFDKQFLIVTKFLDVGVNLLDKSIQNVFVFHQYKEEVVQMLGRKRIAKTDNVTLYLYVPHQNTIQSQLDELAKEYQCMIRDLNAYETRIKCFNQLPPSLYVETKACDLEIKSNYYAQRLNLYHQQQLQQLMSGQEKSDYYEQYAQTVLAWFPQCKGVKWLDRTQKSDIRDKVVEILEPTVNKEFEKKKAVEIANDILRIFNQPRRKEQENSMPISILKYLFQKQDIPYVFRNLSKEGKKGIYVVERGYDWQ